MRIQRPFFKLLVVLSVAASWAPCFAFLPPVVKAPVHSICLSEATNKAEKERESLLEKAARLRNEASDLESKLSPSRTTRRNEEPAAKPAPVYKTMDDSIWTFSYRFSDQPEPNDNENTPKRDFYSGKLTLLMQSDGYTSILSHEEQGMSGLKILKAWGWDVEKSNDNETDDTDYLLFSVDVEVPSVGKEKFYFQASQLVSDAGISLKEGTVTVKASASRAGWGLFSPAGILAQFRYVGDFVAKPSWAE
jgi:hypothetical protein